MNIFFSFSYKIREKTINLHLQHPHTQYNLAKTLLYVYRCDIMTQYSLLAETLLYVYRCDVMTQYSLLAETLL